MKLDVPMVSRMGDNELAILVHFTRKLTDDELCFFHELCHQSARMIDPSAGKTETANDS